MRKRICEQNTKIKVIALVCNSNMFVPYVLSKILNESSCHFLVLSDVASIEEFFLHINLDNVFFYKYGPNDKFDIISCKKRIMSQFYKYDITKIIFFHAEVGELINWFLKKISKHIPIFYCKVFDTLPYPKANLFKAVKTKIKQYLFWGINMDVLDLGGGVKPSLPKKFFEKIGAQEISINIDNVLIEQSIANLLNKLDIRANYVLLTGTVVDCHYVSMEEYTEGVNRIINSLNAENIISKCHPRFSSLFGKESALKQVPSFIPGNLIINNFNVFIGYESTLLVEAAHAGKIAISLLDYFKPINLKTKNNWHSFLENRLNNHGTIYYPKNISEIKSLLSK